MSVFDDLLSVRTESRQRTAKGGALGRLRAVALVFNNRAPSGHPIVSTSAASFPSASGERSFAKLCFLFPQGPLTLGPCGGPIREPLRLVHTPLSGASGWVWSSPLPGSSHFAFASRAKSCTSAGGRLVPRAF